MAISIIPLFSWCLATAFFQHSCEASPLSKRAITVKFPRLFDNVASSKNLSWQTCKTGYSCALLEVPLDYSKPNGVKTFVPIIKKSATARPYKGIVFINPGGPGLSAVDWLLTSGESLNAAGIVGTKYDVAAFDPRGIGYFRPAADCNLPLAKRTYNQAYGPRLSPLFYDQTDQFQQFLGPTCAGSIGGNKQAGPHMSTQVVARDALSIMNAYSTSSCSAGVQNSNLFNFWGISYGTIIGQTFAQLFPNRVGRFVLDGVLDAEDYYSGAGLKNVNLADFALSRFIDYCAKADSTCGFTAATGQKIYQRFENLVLQLDWKKGLAQNWANATALYTALTIVKVYGTLGLSNSIGPDIPSLADYANTLATIEQFVAAGITQAQLEVFPLSTLDPEWLPAVLCPDTGNKVLGKNLTQLQSQLNSIEQQSWIAGEVLASTGIACAHWSIKGKQRYTGGFGGSTKTPIQFVSNTVDPRTPIMNGIKAITLYQNSRLLTIDALGHTSTNVANQCGFNKIRQYFQTGLPTTSFCPQEAGPFGVTLSTPIVAKREDDIEKQIAKLP